MTWFALNYPRVVLLALVISTGLGLVFAASTSTAAFGTFNSEWNGASDLQEEANSVDVDSQIIRDTSQYGNVSANGTIAVILSPKTGYGPTEAERVNRFVRNGGTVLVAEDFRDHTDELLADLGADARIDGQPLRDDRYNYRGSDLPVARNVSEHPLVGSVTSVTLNHGTVVRPNGATVLVSTSDYAYVDANLNGELDDQEALDSYPVATVEQVGEGRVIVVGDPSLLINAMLDRPGNQAFVRSMFSAHDRVLLDYSHAGELPLLSVAVLVLRDSTALQALLSSIGITVIGVWTRRPDLLQQVRDKLSGNKSESIYTEPAELTAFVQHRHSDWDDERIQRVVKEIRRRR
jgi:hypothetical protein